MIISFLFLLSEFFVLPSTALPHRHLAAPPRIEDRQKLREHERAFLPHIKSVQKWKQIASTLGEPENFAPSVVPLNEGGYRTFWNSKSNRGITSATSSDGLNFTPDSGVRLGPIDDPKDCIASHPWVVPMDSGYRMYYQANATFCTGSEPQPGQRPDFRIYSAFSTDGLNFTREGVRIDTGKSTGLAQAAHGRILKLADGTYRLYFSANKIGKDGPADLLGASSIDGLDWTLDDTLILERGHDPAVIAHDGKIYLYTTFLGDNFVILESADGKNFTPVSWVEFYDQNGRRLEEFGDIDIIETGENGVLIFGTGRGSRGVGVFQKME